MSKHIPDVSYLFALIASVVSISYWIRMHIEQKMKQNTKERCLLEESTLFSEMMKKTQQIEVPNVKLEG